MSIPANISPHLRRKAARIKRELQREFANGGMPRYLDALFGPGTWRYDEREKLWIVPDTKYRGPGLKYYCINIKGDWFKAHMTAQDTQ